MSESIDTAAPGLPSLALVPKADGKQSAKDFTTDQEVRWCPGCGDYAILAAVQGFLPELGRRAARTSSSSPASAARRGSRTT